MKTEHFCKFSIRDKDGNLKFQSASRNFAFKTGINLFGNYFTNAECPAAWYLGLVAGITSTGPFNVEDDVPASHGGRWSETAMNYDATDLEMPRALWEPVLNSWSDGDWHGYEISGTGEWTATKFYYPPDGDPDVPGEVFLNVTGVHPGGVLYADAPLYILEERLEPEHALYLVNEDPVYFGMLCELPWDPEVFGATIPFDTTEDFANPSMEINVGDTITLEYTMRFQIENTGT